MSRPVAQRVEAMDDSDEIGLIFETLQLNVDETLKKAEERMMRNYDVLERVVRRTLKGRRHVRPKGFRDAKTIRRP